MTCVPAGARTASGERAAWGLEAAAPGSLADDACFCLDRGALGAGRFGFGFGESLTSPFISGAFITSCFTLLLRSDTPLLLLRAGEGSLAAGEALSRGDFFTTSTTLLRTVFGNEYFSLFSLKLKFFFVFLCLSVA